MLQTLDPRAVKATIEEILAGTNPSAKVSAVKLLADLEAFRQGQERERDHDAEVKGAREKLLRLLDLQAERGERGDARRQEEELGRLRLRVAELEAQLAEYQVPA